jgi:hypothetical protein
MPGKYDDYDWDELPEEAKKAAQVLGYDKVGTSWLQVMRVSDFTLISFSTCTNQSYLVRLNIARKCGTRIRIQKALMT